MDKIRNEEWEYYISGVENENGLILEDEDKLDIFKTVFADVDGHQTDGYNYCLAINKNSSNENQISKPQKKKSTAQILALPLVGEDLKKAIEAANWKLENLLQMMKPRHPELVRKLWNPEKYIMKFSDQTCCQLIGTTRFL